MKKQFVCLILCSVLVGCIRAGDYDLVPVRKKIFNAINGYSIDYKEAGEEFVGRENVREHEYVMNKAITVQKGEPILSDKTYSRDSYKTIVYKPSKKGAIHNHAYPMRLDNKEEYDIVGWITVDGVDYSLLESDVDDYVFLFDTKGNFYNKAGRVNDGIVTLLDEDIFVYPSDLKMVEVAKIKDVVSDVKNGYEIKYGGVKLDRLWFDYMEYDQDDNDGGQFEKINFPNEPGLIMINGKGFRVLNADKNSLTYMILKD